MNLIEAIKSGKKFRRQSWTNQNYWVEDHLNGSGFSSELVDQQDEIGKIDIADLIADDYEIKD